MGNVIQFGVLGCGTGAVLGLLAVGLVLIFRGAGVVNLSHGAVAMFSAYLYWEFRSSNVPFAASIAVAVLVAAALGFAIDQLLLRRLRSASALTRLIATMGVLLVLQTVTAWIWGTFPKTIAPIFPSRVISMGKAALPSDRLWLLLVAVVITTAIAAVWRHTRLGWIAEAVSENQRLAKTLGWSPELVSGITWAVGAGVAGLAGILVAPITQLDTTTMPLLVVPALAAALIGGFRSFAGTLAGAVGIGIAQSETAQYVSLPGASDALPFLVIILVLIIRGSSLPLRGQATDRLPRVGTGRVHWVTVAIVSTVVIAGLASMSSPDWLSVLTSTSAEATVLLSFVVLVGYSGQLSLAQWSLAGFGALFAARLAASDGLPFWLALVLGALGSAVIGVLFALPALRTRGVNLVVVTLGLSLAANSVIFNNPNYSGGVSGILVPSPTLFGFSIDPVLHPQRYAIFAFAVFVVAALGVARLRRTSIGRVLLAIRDNERAAASNGINIVLGKMLGFAIAGGVAGTGGIVLAFQSQAVSFGGYDPLSSIATLAYSVVGGVGFLLGPVFGATLAPSSVGTIVSLHLQGFTSYLPMIAAGALLVTIVTNPHGWVYGVLRLLQRPALPRPHQAVPALWRRQRAITREPPRTAGQRRSAATRAPDETVTARTLAVAGLSVRYGGNQAVDAVNLVVSPGEIVGLIGPNGAGKTSFMDAVTGFARPSGGAVNLDQVAITRWPAHRRARAGLVRSFQGLELYPDMTVEENVLAAVDHHDIAGLARDFITSRGSHLTPYTQDVLREFGLQGALDRLPEELSYGQRRLLAIARAAAAGPSILLVDEPVAGLDDTESAEFARVLQSLAHRRGMSVLVIEHDMNFVMGICDRIAVVDFGRKIAEGTPLQIQGDEAAVAAYLGDETPEQVDGLPGHRSGWQVQGSRRPISSAAPITAAAVSSSASPR